MPAQRIFLIRHGETAWSLSGQHTGTTDIPLTEKGRALARKLAPILAKVNFAQVFVSPLQRARETCDLAGLGARAQVDRDLVEWNYGDYEGLTPDEIHERAPGWLIFRDGGPNGESPDDVGSRADAVIARVRAIEGDVALVAHGHIFRVFVARWIGLPASGGRHFLLDPATLSVLSFYRGGAAIKRWNAPIEVEGTQVFQSSQERMSNVVPEG